MGVCLCGFCNVWVSVRFWFCNVRVCVGLSFLMCGCVYVWVF